MGRPFDELPPVAQQANLLINDVIDTQQPKPGVSMSFDGLTTSVAFTGQNQVAALNNQDMTFGTPGQGLGA